jgi:hypothetical protein
MTAVPNPRHQTGPDTGHRTLQRRVVRAVLTLGALVLAATAGIVLSPGADTTIAAADVPMGPGGEYHAVNPTRVFDSRFANQNPQKSTSPKPSGPSAGVAFHIPLIDGLSPLKGTDGDNDGLDDHVLAVVANVTIAAPTRDGHATIYPKGESAPNASVVNFKAGQTVANSAILRPGVDGAVTVFLNTPSGAGSAHFIVDISGWFSTSGYHTHGARVRTIEPVRLYDSNVVTGSTLKGVQQLPLQVRGQKGVPNAAVGVIVNLTGVNAFGGSTSTHMSLVPEAFNTGDKRTWPKTSTLNLSPGQTRANLAVVPIGSDGKIRVFNLQGETRIVVDVTGYLVPGDGLGAREGRVIPLVSSFRSFDTRRDEFGDQPLGPAMAEDFSFEAFVGDVKVGSEPVGAQSGLFGNLTAVGLEPNPGWQVNERSHMTVYPTPAGGSQTPPNISNLNLGMGEAVPNMALLRFGDQNRIRFFNFDGYVDYILDVYAVVLAD